MQSTGRRGFSEGSRDKYEEQKKIQHLQCQVQHLEEDRQHETTVQDHKLRELERSIELREQLNEEISKEMERLKLENIDYRIKMSQGVVASAKDKDQIQIFEDKISELLEVVEQRDRTIAALRRQYSSEARDRLQREQDAKITSETNKPTDCTHSIEIEKLTSELEEARHHMNIAVGQIRDAQNQFEASLEENEELRSRVADLEEEITELRRPSRESEGRLMQQSGLAGRIKKNRVNWDARDLQLSLPQSQPSISGKAVRILGSPFQSPTSSSGKLSASPRNAKSLFDEMGPLSGVSQESSVRQEEIQQQQVSGNRAQTSTATQTMPYVAHDRTVQTSPTFAQHRSIDSFAYSTQDASTQTLPFQSLDQEVENPQVTQGTQTTNETLDANSAEEANDKKVTIVSIAPKNRNLFLTPEQPKANSDSPGDSGFRSMPSNSSTSSISTDATSPPGSEDWHMLNKARPSRRKPPPSRLRFPVGPLSSTRPASNKNHSMPASTAAPRRDHESKPLTPNNLVPELRHHIKAFKGETDGSLWEMQFPSSRMASPAFEVENSKDDRQAIETDAERPLHDGRVILEVEQDEGSPEMFTSAKLADPFVNSPEMTRDNELCPKLPAVVNNEDQADEETEVVEGQPGTPQHKEIDTREQQHEEPLGTSEPEALTDPTVELKPEGVEIDSWIEEATDSSTDDDRQKDETIAVDQMSPEDKSHVVLQEEPEDYSSDIAMSGQVNDPNVQCQAVPESCEGSTKKRPNADAHVPDKPVTAATELSIKLHSDVVADEQTEKASQANGEEQAAEERTTSIKETDVRLTTDEHDISQSEPRTSPDSPGYAVPNESRAITRPQQLRLSGPFSDESKARFDAAVRSGDIDLTIDTTEHDLVYFGSNWNEMYLSIIKSPVWCNDLALREALFRDQQRLLMPEQGPILQQYLQTYEQEQLQQSSPVWCSDLPLRDALFEIPETHPVSVNGTIAEPNPQPFSPEGVNHSSPVWCSDLPLRDALFQDQRYSALLSQETIPEPNSEPLILGPPYESSTNTSSTASSDSIITDYTSYSGATTNDDDDATSTSSLPIATAAPEPIPNGSTNTPSHTTSTAPTTIILILSTTPTTTNTTTNSHLHSLRFLLLTTLTLCLTIFLATTVMFLSTYEHRQAWFDANYSSYRARVIYTGNLGNVVVRNRWLDGVVLWVVEVLGLREEVFGFRAVNS